MPAGRSWEDGREGTQQLLTLLWETGYKVSRKKAQICQEKGKYLGFHLSQGAEPTRPREEAGCLFDPGPVNPTPDFSWPQVSVEPGYMTFQSWENPSMRLQRGGEREPLIWESVQQKAFEEIK